MKKLTIFQENNPPIIFKDSDNTPLKEYVNKLSKMLEINNINILETDGFAIIQRPHKISSIVVEEYKKDNTPPDVIKLKKGKTKNKSKKEANISPISPPPAPKPKQDSKNLEQNNKNEDIITD